MKKIQSIKNYLFVVSIIKNCDAIKIFILIKKLYYALINIHNTLIHKNIFCVSKKYLLKCDHIIIGIY